MITNWVAIEIYSVPEPEVQDQGVSTAVFPVQTLGKSLFLPLPSFWWLAAVLGVPWLAAASLQFVFT